MIKEDCLGERFYKGLLCCFYIGTHILTIGLELIPYRTFHLPPLVEFLFLIFTLQFWHVLRSKHLWNIPKIKKLSWALKVMRQAGNWLIRILAWVVQRSFPPPTLEYFNAGALIKIQRRSMFKKKKMEHFDIHDHE